MPMPTFMYLCAENCYQKKADEVKFLRRIKCCRKTGNYRDENVRSELHVAISTEQLKRKMSI